MRVSDLTIDRIYVNSLIRQAEYKMQDNHFHFYYEIYYLRQGECQMYISDRQYHMTGGDFLVIPPREIHINQYTTACERINVYFRQSDMFQDDQLIYPQLAENLMKPGITHIPSAYRSSVESLLERMLQEELIDDSATPEMMSLLFRQLLLDIARYGIHRENTAPAFNEANKEILEAVQYIKEHYNQTLNLEKMANLAGLSMTYFSRKFHQVTGMGMKEFLTYIRLSNAEKELLSTNHSITEVALNCGFSNSNYFKDAFKKTYGMSPKTYRKSRVTDLMTHQSVINAEKTQSTDTYSDLSEGT